MDELKGQDCRNNRGDAETNKAELNDVSIAGSYISESGVVKLTNNAAASNIDWRLFRVTNNPNRTRIVMPAIPAPTQ